MSEASDLLDLASKKLQEAIEALRKSRKHLRIVERKMLKLRESLKIENR